MSDNVVSMAEFRSRREMQDVADRPRPVFNDDGTVHHWTSSWRGLLETILRPPEQLTPWQVELLARIEWQDPSPVSRGETDRALRILRGTDHGSNDGNAEGHHRDPGVPRG